MSLSAEQITIAITVYSRRQYIRQAIASALDQTVPVRVMVVEDCGPDPTLEGFVKAEFGSRIEYVRNPKRRGIFGNWNACLELCRTEWISILHDDDFLAPVFVEAMIDLEKEAPGRELYFGRTVLVDERGTVVAEQDLRPLEGRWMERDLRDILFSTFSFAGKLFRVSSAKLLSGFRVNSFNSADWEMWANLMAKGGAVQSSQTVAFDRNHSGWDRGTRQVERSGRNLPTYYVQHKRVLAKLPPASGMKFDRAELLKRSPMSVIFLLRFGDTLSPRVLRYHVGLLLLSPTPHWRYAIFQQLARVGGPRFVKLISRVWNQCVGHSQNPKCGQAGPTRQMPRPAEDRSSQ
jgi:glycosyltransferase involved in cell wall biosynthesis